MRAAQPLLTSKAFTELWFPSTSVLEELLHVSAAEDAEEHRGVAGEAKTLPRLMHVRAAVSHTCTVPFFGKCVHTLLPNPTLLQPETLASCSVTNYL